MTRLEKVVIESYLSVIWRHQVPNEQRPKAVLIDHLLYLREQLRNARPRLALCRDRSTETAGKKTFLLFQRL